METIETTIPDNQVQSFIDELLRIGFQPIVADNLIPTATNVENPETRTQEAK